MPASSSAYDQLDSDTCPTSASALGVVGHCPDCGCPIYGRSVIFLGDKPPIVMSCRCSDDLTLELES
jgi:hypothetical protein